MFTYPVSLNPTSFGGANAAKSFDLVDLQNNRTLSRVAATATTTPETLTVSHSQSGSVVVYDRHLVRLDKTMTDPILGKVTFSAYLNLVIPRGTSVVTLQEIKDMVGRLIAFEQASGALDKILNNEP
jgi:hypothetical protein